MLWMFLIWKKLMMSTFRAAYYHGRVWRGEATDPAWPASSDLLESSYRRWKSLRMSRSRRDVWDKVALWLTVALIIMTAVECAWCHLRTPFRILFLFRRPNADLCVFICLFFVYTVFIIRIPICYCCWSNCLYLHKGRYCEGSHLYSIDCHINQSTRV